MLKFYTDISKITPENRKRVFPMLFDWFYKENQELRLHFQIVDSLESADICILPLDLGYYLSNAKKNEVDFFTTSAKEYNKIIWLYSGGDFGTTCTDDVITFRLGGYHSKLSKNTFVMPSFINDPYETFIKTDWEPLVKQNKPTVGFVGNADGSFYKWTKELAIYCQKSVYRLVKKDYSDWQLFFPSSSVRYRLLEKLRNTNGVETNFIYRNKYRAGVTNEADKIKTTLEFYNNMERNLYTFCLRGSGNFSVRFYETLMMGRIPLLIDTDVRLPLENVIAWENHCIKASENNFIEKLLEFHSNHTNEELIEIQKSNRILAKQLLGRIVYFVEVSKNKNIS